jgi:hypothetical protein
MTAAGGFGAARAATIDVAVAGNVGPGAKAVWPRAALNLVRLEAATAMSSPWRSPSCRRSSAA